MYIAFIHPWLDCGHLLCYGAASTHLYRLNSLQHHAEGIYSTTFSLLSSGLQEAAFGMISKLLDGESHGTYSPFVHTLPPTTLEDLLVCLHPVIQLRIAV